MIDRGEVVVSGRLPRLLTAATLARTADASAGVVIILTSIERYGSPAPGAIALAALLIPHVVAGPFAGIITDRARRPRLVHAAFVAVFALFLGAVPLLLGRLPLPAVVLLAVIAGTCGPMIFGGLSSRVDDVTPPDRRPHPAASTPPRTTSPRSPDPRRAPGSPPPSAVLSLPLYSREPR